MRHTFKMKAILLFLLGSISISGLWAQLSWGDLQASGVRESASSGMFTPGRLAFDSDVSTAWILSSGSRTGWAERYWNSPQRIAGVSVNVRLPQDVSLQFAYLGNNEWVPIPGAVITGAQDGLVSLTFPGELPPTSRILATLTGPSADQARVNEIIFTASQAPSPYGKILPQSYSFNQSEYINLKASRLWDGLIAGNWFSPNWSVPWELTNSGTPDQVTKVFPPYFGNPPKEGEIVWQLGGTYSIQTLKAYFIQNYQSVQFDFWDGAKWTGTQVFGGGWSDPGSGWKRIDLRTPITTTKVRITFPGGWARAGAIGELEVWGQGWNEATPQAVVLPEPDSNGSYFFTIADSSVKDRLVEVAVDGKLATSLGGEWNGVAFTATPTTWIGGDTIYRISLLKETTRSDSQFLKLNAPARLHGVVLKDLDNRGQIDLGSALSDGQFANTQAAPGTSVSVSKAQTWRFQVPFELEKIRVFTTAADPGTFQSARNGQVNNISWTSSGNGWWEASLVGVAADQISFKSQTPICFDEIQLWGSPLADSRVGMEIWWPQGAVKSNTLDGNSVIGWMGSPSVIPLIGTYHPRQSDRLFWMPLSGMGLTPEQVTTLTVQGTLGQASFNQGLFVNWQGSSVKVSLDQGTDLSSVDRSNFTLSGSVKFANARVFVKGREVGLVGGNFSTTVELASGFQLLTVDVWDKSLKRQLAQLTKPVYRTFGLPILQLGLPAGDLWTQSTSLTITGLVGNGTGLSLAINGKTVSLAGNAWTQNVQTGEGPQILHFVLKDDAGRVLNKDLVVNKVSTPPTVSFGAPTEGQYLALSPVFFQIKGSIPKYWWSIDGGSWEPAETQTITVPYSRPDGFYKDTVVIQDRAGNLSDPAEVTFCLDTTPPSPFVIGSNVAGWTSNNKPTINFATNDRTSGLDHFEYMVDTGRFIPAGSPLELPTLDDGSHTVYVKAEDKSGNTTMESLDLYIDTTPPPVPTSVVAVPGADLVTLSWVGVDDREGYQTYRVERLPAWPDGVHVIDGKSYGTQSLTDGALTAGEAYQYRVWAVDRARNIGVKTAWTSAQVGVGTATINTTGETIVKFNQAAVTIPQNAAAADIVSVQIHQIPVEAVGSAPVNPLVSMVFHFSVLRTDGQGTVETDHADFSAPVEMRISYDPDKLPPGYTPSELKPFYFDDLWGRWVPVEGAFVDTVNQVVNFSTTHFTDFTVQASHESDQTPQQLRDVQFSPFGTKIGPEPVAISPKEGVVSAGFTELVLPGKAGSDLVVKRVYDSGTAQSNSAERVAARDGSYPWYLGPGWKLNFPFMKWSGAGLWITGLDGTSFSFSQSNLALVREDGDLKTVVMNNHEGSDSQVEVVFRKNTPPDRPKWWTDSIANTYSYVSAKLLMKDGREIDYDSLGRVIRYSDTTRLNWVGFAYDGNRATVVTDSMGRTIGFEYNDGGCIKSMTLNAGDSQAAVTYAYDPDNTLTSVTDIGGRTWTYTYEPKSLISKTYFEYVGYTNPPPRTTKVLLLKSASGPGAGTTTVRNAVITQTTRSSDQGVTFSVSQDRLIADELVVGLTADSPSRYSHYTYTFDDSDLGDHFTVASSIDDGRTKTTTTYTKFAKKRASLSSAPEALKVGLGFDVGTRSTDAENVTLVDTSKVFAAGTLVESTKQEWDADTLRLKSSKINRSETNYSSTSYVYDLWGNPTSVISSSTVDGTLFSDSSVTSVYLLDGVKNLSGFPKNLSLSRTKISSGTIADHSPVSTREESKMTYTDNGQVFVSSQLINGSWAETTYSYGPNGEVAGVLDPSQQSTTYGYDYAVALSSGTEGYRVTTTKLRVNLGAATKDLVSVSEYRYLDGSNTATTDFRNFRTTKSFDTLGRVTQVTEPSDNGGTIPTTNIQYDDANLTSLVTNPLKLSSLYSFDRLGRLMSIIKTDAATSETITTKLTYDVYDQVTEVHGPVSTDEPDSARTLDSVVAKYSYDFRGRVASTLAPGAEVPKTSLYDDAKNQVTTFDEVGSESSQITDWNGKGVVQQTIVDGKPLTTRAFFDGAGRRIASIDPNLNLTTYTYNGLGLEDTVTSQPRTVVEDGRSIDGVSPTTTKGYDGAGRLIRTSQSLSGARSKTTSLTLNGLGYILSSSTPVTVMNLAQKGSLKTLLVTYTYDEAGNKLSEASGYSGEKSTMKRWQYDSHGRVLGETDERGNTVAYEYDPVGNRTMVTDPRNKAGTSNFQLKLIYNEFGRLVQSVLPHFDGAAPSTFFRYNGRGDLVRRVEADGQTTEYAYNLRGQLSAETLMNGSNGYTTTSHQYDAAGRETAVVTPSGTTTYKEYDAASRLSRVGNNIAGWTRFTYDGNGNQVTSTDGRDHTTETSAYTPENQPLSVTVKDVKGRTKTISYDRSGLVTQTVDAEKNKRTYRYDELGRVLSETTPWGVTLNSTVWDARGVPINQWDASGTRFDRTYLATGLLESETAIRGSETLTRGFTYDAGGELMSASDSGELPSASDNGTVTSYNLVGGTYQPDPYGLTRGKTTSVGGRSLTMAYRYDSRQRLTGVTYPDATSVNYEYNTLNQVTAMPGWLSGTVSYDEYGRFAGYTSSGLKKVVGYDSQDRTRTISYAAAGDTIGSYDLGYDLAGNISSRNQNNYFYDAVNQLVASNEQGWFQKTPDEVARVADYGIAPRDYTGNEEIEFAIQGTTLDTASQSIGLDLHESMGVNKIQLVPQSATHRVTVKELTVWAGNNNRDDYVKVTGWKSATASDGSITLFFPKIFTARYVKINTTWDDRDIDNVSVDTYATFKNSTKNLVKVWALRTSQLSGFDYDNQGNRSASTVDGQARSYRYYKNVDAGNLPWLASDGTWFYAYDLNGNLVTKAKSAILDTSFAKRSFTVDTTQEYWSYIWDLRNRLVSVLKNGALLVSYTYDADNLRSSRVTTSETTLYAYGRKGAIAYEKNTATGAARTYTYLNDSTVGWIDTAPDGVQTKMYATVDQVGSVTNVSDSSGNLVWSSEYQPFGKVSGVEGLYSFDGSYAGHEVDADTGLVYMWNRWQDPTTGRFVSEDPARDGGNWYSYAGSNPLIYTDPTGLMTAEEMASYYAQQAGQKINVDTDGSVSTSTRSHNDQSSSLTTARQATAQVARVAEHQRTMDNGFGFLGRFLEGVDVLASLVAGAAAGLGRESSDRHSAKRWPVLNHEINDFDGPIKGAEKLSRRLTVGAALLWLGETASLYGDHREQQAGRTFVKGGLSLVSGLVAGGVTGRYAGPAAGALAGAVVSEGVNLGFDLANGGNQ